MPERAAQVPYNPVPSAQPEINATGPMNVRANPNDFGAQVSEAEQGAGKEIFDLAQKQQGMINETAMTNADANFAMKVGDIKGKYTALTGQAAFNAFPQYQHDIQSAFQATRSGLPPAAQRGFDMMATRTMANHIADGSSYASSQLKEANRDAYSSMASANMRALTDPSVASDPARSQFHIDSLKYAAQAQVDDNHPGLKTDTETGAVSFDDSPAGKIGKVQLQQKQDALVSQGYINKYNTLAKTDPIGAYNQYQKERDDIPRQGQVALDASFAPKIFNSHVQGGATTALTQASQDHANLLYNPDSSKGAIDTVLKNEGGLSPDGHAIYGIDKNSHPAEFDLAKEITDEKGQTAGQEYAKNFYKTEYFDKKGIETLPLETQSIVMDGVVNHSSAFGDKLIQAAKDGATPQQLIDMRQGEYHRLATENPDKYGQYSQGWNNRLTNLQSGLAMEGKPKPYGANPDGSSLTQADYFKTHSEDVYASGDAYAEKMMPGDLALKRAVRESLGNYMNKTISNQSAQYMMDNKNVMRGITGELSKGQAPETEADLRAIPGMGSLLDKVAAQDPKFAEGIPTMIAKAQHADAVNNSSNAYDTIQAMLDTSKGATRQSRIEYLSKGLGTTNPGFSISQKDFNDAKPAIDLPSGQKILSDHMQQIATANGNIDGKGQQRAVQWYNQAMTAYKQNEAMGDKKDPNFFVTLKDKISLPQPSTMQQISDAYHNLIGSPKVQPDAIRVTGPDGKVGTIPASQLQDALNSGYMRVK